MKTYILVYKFIKQVLTIVFWGILLPAVLLFTTIPLALPVIYAMEKNVDSLSSDDVALPEFKFTQPYVNKQHSFGTFKINKGEFKLKEKDYRAIVLDEYFKRNDSPLVGLGKVFVAACDKYDAPFDCTTLPAIGYVETRLCTLQLSHAQRNCWGFGGSGPNRIWFEKYPDAVYLITDRLVNSYGPSYMTNPESMQYTYCGPHCHAWGPAVQQQRYVINNIALELGYPALIR